ncbi:MAG: hypothetical protein S4CHLAM37_13430 [Chlamydiia bacterium]|nr:hypothetical protein [Chlamydiia bacterium]
MIDLASSSEITRLLVSLKSKGILAGPDESLCDLTKRVKLIEQFSLNSAEMKEKLGFNPTKFMKITDNILELEIDWLFELKKRSTCSFLQPACTWIHHLDGMNYPIIAISKIRKDMKSEALRHELVHIVRASFNEPIYEEYIAYAFSKSKWRAFLGPIFRHSYECLGFVCISLMVSLLQLFIETSWYSVGTYAFLVAAGFARLIYHHRVFKKALKAISNVFRVDSPEKIAIFLTDYEIRYFSKKDNSEIKKYIKKQKSPRWQQILLSYPFD